jgi:ubiquinone/menaquinone biosynthesis C-methylase UbiE
MQGHRRQHNALTYRLELGVMRLRDRLRLPAKVLLSAGVQTGMTVLDFGCGPGGFALAAAQIVGPQGLVYALDVQPLALRLVHRTALRRRVANVRPVLASHISEVPEESVDVVLLYDVLHIPGEPAATGEMLQSIHRVLKSDGTLSVRDHHLQEAPLLTLVTGNGLFRPSGGHRPTFQFEKIATRGVTP